MSTLYDWVSILIFIGLLMLYFLRQERNDEPVGRYVMASAACALANYLGNHEYQLAALAVTAATMYYIYHFILVRTRTGDGRPH